MRRIFNHTEIVSFGAIRFDFGAIRFDFGAIKKHLRDEVAAQYGG